MSDDISTRSVERPERLSPARQGLPSADACKAAGRRLAPYLVRTPVRPLPWLAKRLGRPVFAKLEHLQHTGSFKFRGALNALMQIPRHAVVVASSAGNHSLAIAEAARLTGHRVVVCMPLTASPIKRERLAPYGVAVIDHGDTLDEAISHGRAFAASEGYVFVSPYNDADVIAGQSTIGAELADDIPGLDTVVVPVGGGGLVTGIGLALEAASPGANIVGVQPERFAAMARTLRGGALHREVYRPSLADGLLVNLESESATIDWASRHLGRIVTLDEEHIAGGVLALFAREALACEPSGAIGIAAALAGRLDDLPGQGAIAIVLTGGNMTLATLARVLEFPFRDPDLVRALELRHRAAEDETVFQPAAGSGENRFVDERDWDQTALLLSLQGRVGLYEHALSDFVEVCRRETLPVNAVEKTFLGAVMDGARRLCEQAMQADTDPVERQRLLRIGSRTAAFLDQAIAWQAPSYEQTQVAAFNAVSSQQSTQVNYTRYASARVAALEDTLAETLGLDRNHSTVLATSSGMAAYSLVESFLLRYRLAPGDRVVCQPGLYFETFEQLKSLGHLKVVTAADDSEDAIVAAVVSEPTCAVFVEPLVNSPDLRLIDIERLLARLDQAVDAPLTVVVDGTMLSGAVDPHKAARDLTKVDVLYTESGSKYLQAGLDLVTLGVVACSWTLRPVMDRLRRNTGTILYDAAAAVVPRLSRAAYLARMRRMTENARLIGETIARTVPVRAGIGVTPIFPGLEGHPDHANAGRYAHLGGIITFRFHPDGLNNRWLLDAAIDHVLEEAKRRGVALTKGVSFGFSVPRISAAWAMAETSQPFLRLSVGDQSAAETAAFADALAAGFTSFLRTYEDRLDIYAREPAP